MIFVLGCGNIGSLVGLALLRVSKSEVVYIFKNQSSLAKFIRNDTKLTINFTNSLEPARITSFNAVTLQQLNEIQHEKSLTSLLRKNELGSFFIDESSKPEVGQSVDDSPLLYIDNLIITTKAHKTIESLIPIMHLVNQKTNLIFLQNGAGAVEQLYKQYFRQMPESKAPKNIYQGVITHGVHSIAKDKFVFNHINRETGELKLGKFMPLIKKKKVKSSIVQDFKNLKAKPLVGQRSSSSYKRKNIIATAENIDELVEQEPTPPIIQDLLRSDLNASYFSDPLDFKLLYFEKLIVNSIINPLSVIFECSNGELRRISLFNLLVNGLIREDAAILKKHFILPSQVTECSSSVWNTFLSRQRLKGVVNKVLDSTSNNYSSMLQDFKLSRKSLEIYYMNQYFVTLAKGRAPLNKMLISMVQGKQDIQQLRAMETKL